MPGTSGPNAKRAVLYAHVATDEQAKGGYLTVRHLHNLRPYLEAAP